jgi:integrase
VQREPHVCKCCVRVAEQPQGYRSIAAQIEDVRVHDLRHTVGTYAGQSGANAFFVRDLLRHKNLVMTGRYVNRADSPARTLSNQVGERIAAAMAEWPLAEVVPLKKNA